MERRDGAMRNRTLVDNDAAPAASRAQRWTGGVIALLLLITCWGAWVCLIGYRPCVLSYGLWRETSLEHMQRTGQARTPPDDAHRSSAPGPRVSPS